MNHKIIVLLFCLLQGAVFSQNKKIDSLINQLPFLIDDTNKVILYENIIREIDTTNSTLAREYAIYGINLSKSLNYGLGRRTCYFLYIRSLIKKALFDEAQNFNLKYYGSCEKELDLEGMRISFMVNGGLLSEISEHERLIKERSEKLEQEKKDALIAAENKRQKIILYSIGTGSILLTLLITVILRSLIQNKKKNKLILHQKELVEAKQKEIIDSIHYAKRIQHALLPSEIYIKRNLNKQV